MGETAGFLVDVGSVLLREGGMGFWGVRREASEGGLAVQDGRVRGV